MYLYIYKVISSFFQITNHALIILRSLLFPERQPVCAAVCGDVHPQLRVQLAR